MTFLGPELSRSAVSFHSNGPLSFIPLWLLSCFLPWNSNGSDPGFPASAPSPHPSPGLPGFLALSSCLRFAPRSMDVASTPFGPISFSSVFILKIAVFPGEPFPGSGPLCLLGREVCPCKFPFPQGWPFARVLSSWLLSWAPLEGRGGDHAEVGWRVVERRQLRWAGTPVHTTALCPRLGGGWDVRTQFRV